MRRCRLLLYIALAAVPLAVALPLAAQTPSPTPGPSATPATGAASPGLVFPTLTPGPATTATPAPTANPLLPYNPFLLAAIMQQSDLPAGDLIIVQAPLGPDDLGDMFADLDVTPAAGFLQIFAPIEAVEGGSGGALGALLGASPGSTSGLDALFVLGSQQDASTALDALKQAGTLGGDTSDLSNVQTVAAPAIGDEAVEITATQTDTDSDTGETTTANLALVAARRGSVIYIVETTDVGNPRPAAETTATAFDARVQKALPLLPAP